MARKKKNITKIRLIPSDDTNIREPKPSCFNTKRDYCIRELCGKWFDECKAEEDDDNPG